MSYWFNVETSEGNNYEFIPEEFKNNKDVDLADYDYYTLEHRENLRKLISEKINIAESKINKITIDHTRNKKTENNNPYSLILGNTELEELLEKENGKFKHLTMGRRDFFNNGKKDIRVIYAIDPIFIKMRSYILNNIEKFSQEIYNSNGEMGKIIRGYNNVIKTQSDNSYIERKFHDYLTEYKSFRSVSMAKYRYDRGIRDYRFNVDNNDTSTVKTVPTKSNIVGGFTPEKIKDYYNGGLEQFNHENEEFLEPDEFEQMINFDGNKEKRI